MMLKLVSSGRNDTVKLHVEYFFYAYRSLFEDSVMGDFYIYFQI